MITAYPLHWPGGWPRTPKPQTSKFKTALTTALKNVKTSITLFGNDSGNPVSEITISSNVSLGHDKPQDSGVALWFKWEGSLMCIAVDRYVKVEENLQAIHFIIESRRTELRHGGLHLIRQAFAGFKTLPAANDCWKILGIPATSQLPEINKAYKEKAKELQNNHAALSSLNVARDEAERLCK